LEAGAQVVGLVRRLSPRSHLALSGAAARMDLHYADITDADAVQHAVAATLPDTVFHLAAQAFVQVAKRNPADTLRSNVQGTWNVLEAVRQTAGVRRLVIASSDKAYGSPRELPLPYTEDYPLRGEYPYDVSKSCADLIAQAYYHTYWREPEDRDHAPQLGITRCGNIYGGGDFGQGRLVPEITTALLRNERPVVRGHGRHVRDFLYVLDAVSGYLMLAEQLDRDEVNGQAFNFGGEQPVTVLDVVQRLIDITG